MPLLWLPAPSNITPPHIPWVAFTQSIPQLPNYSEQTYKLTPNKMAMEKPSLNAPGRESNNVWNQHLISDLPQQVPGQKDTLQTDKKVKDFELIKEI